MNVVNRTVMALILLRRELEKDVLAFAPGGRFLVRTQIVYVAGGRGSSLRRRKPAVKLKLGRFPRLRRLRDALD
jgi:hypothetical protein